MTPANLQFMCGFLRKRSGLVIAADKAYLIESRLNPVARRLGYASIDGMIETLRAMRSPTLEVAVVEAMTTNESTFFRDRLPFERLKVSILPRLLSARAETKRLNIWCAAASTGQEPYSIAIILKEMEAQLRGWRIDILGTDISAGVIEKAKAGIYTQFEVQRGLPIQQLVRNFTQEGEIWRLDAGIRAMVQFRQFNLLDDFAGLGTFDIIFCRNVLIYFDRETKTQVLDRIAKAMAPDGALLLGAAETIIGLTESLRFMQGERGIYEPVNQAAERSSPPRAAVG
jgi:chemotaxis protein methyltransferase CheR